MPIQFGLILQNLVKLQKKKKKRKKRNATVSTVNRCIPHDSGRIWLEFDTIWVIPVCMSCGPTYAHRYPNSHRERYNENVWVCVCVRASDSQRASRGAVLFIIWLDYGSQTCAVWPVRESSAPCIRFLSMMTHSQFHSIKLCVVAQQLHFACQKYASNQTPESIKHWKQVIFVRIMGNLVHHKNIKRTHLHMTAVKLSPTSPNAELCLH